MTFSPTGLGIIRPGSTFDRPRTTIIMREIYYSWALREAMAEEMERDESVFILRENIAEYGGAFK